jgi:hypothetical protein
MELPNIVTSWTQTEIGSWVVPLSILGLGAVHFGYGMGMDLSLPAVGSLGNVAAVAGLIVGTSMILNK